MPGLKFFSIFLSFFFFPLLLIGVESILFCIFTPSPLLMIEIPLDPSLQFFSG